MPNRRVMEGVLTEDQKAEIAEHITETLTSIVGRARPRSDLGRHRRHDQFTIGGRRITAERVKDLLAGAPASA